MLKRLAEATVPTDLYEASRAFISWATKKGKKKKQSDVRYHVCRQAVNIRNVKLRYILFKEMMADCLTKPVGPQKFRIVNELISMLVSFNVTM